VFDCPSSIRVAKYYYSRATEGTVSSCHVRSERWMWITLQKKHSNTCTRILVPVLEGSVWMNSMESKILCSIGSTENSHKTAVQPSDHLESLLFPAHSY
jgi:hypothetical protein